MSPKCIGSFKVLMLQRGTKRATSTILHNNLEIKRVYCSQKSVHFLMVVVFCVLISFIKVKYLHFLFIIYILFDIARKQKQKREEQPRVPRSLFDRANAQLLRLRRDAKLQMKLKMSGNLKPYRPMPTLQPAKPVMEQTPDHPEWLIHEDWALLQVK